MNGFTESARVMMQRCEVVSCLRNKVDICIFTDRKGYEDYADKCAHRNFIKRELEYKQSKKNPPIQLDDKSNGLGGIVGS